MSVAIEAPFRLCMLGCWLLGDRVLFVDSLASIHQRVIHLAVIQAGATAAFANRVSDALSIWHHEQRYKARKNGNSTVALSVGVVRLCRSLQKTCARVGILC